MPGTPGALTTDHVPLLPLYTEFIDSVERHNEDSRNFRTLLCRAPTTTRTVTVRQRSMRFQESAEDTSQPDMQHIDRRDITLADPRRWIINASITMRALEEGVSSDEIREHQAEILDADFRLIAEVCVAAALRDGGWWDAAMAMAPPNYKMNRFLTSHDHYLAYNVAGVPALAHFTRLKRTIMEHGYERQMIAFMNGANAENVENLSEWATAPGPMPTPVMAQLQTQGFTPGFMAAGVPVYTEDWIPEDYILMMSLETKPMAWRIPEGQGLNVEDLLLVNIPSDDFETSIKYGMIAEARRWTSATVVQRGAGAVAYLGGLAYVNPTGFYV